MDDVGPLGSFGVVTKKDGKAVADDSVLRALGMK